jgi:hypothetical protein
MQFTAIIPTTITIARGNSRLNHHPSNSKPQSKRMPWATETVVCDVFYLSSACSLTGMMTVQWHPSEWGNHEKWTNWSFCALMSGDRSMQSNTCTTNRSSAAPLDTSVYTETSHGLMIVVRSSAGLPTFVFLTAFKPGTTSFLARNTQAHIHTPKLRHL